MSKNTNLLSQKLHIDLEKGIFFLFGLERKFLIEENKLIIYTFFEIFEYKLKQNSPNEIKEMIENFLAKQLSNTINMLHNKYLNLINVKDKFKSFKIKKITSYWGKCKSDGNLIYNLYLVCFPLEAIEGVVVHELSHLIHFNHSQKFYNLVNEVYPNYKDSQKYLEQKWVQKIWKKQ
ncbi:M48 family metallopeptidase [Mycoplasma miroungirhinis]|uniref:M48 family metallopeptidase n=1 Tax=Mycoplasma miroungirhinis TaxID=754516 RepID=A0A6M4JI34_9MOLU|nr:M48 family metallopeptidase [Mycoplasma miroungirhinis]QJR44111.1 M48 family metallopeptidase [Mycoplasma miroungirhinis]